MHLDATWSSLLLATTMLPNNSDNATPNVDDVNSHFNPNPLTLGGQESLVIVPLDRAILMTLVYGLIFVTGIMGNVCTCVVIPRNKDMHTATNFYLFSLAISDLMLLIFGLPHEMYHLWVPFVPYTLGENFCVFRGFTAETSTNASILTITAFTVERYLAICHPLRSHTMSKLSRVVKIILVSWVVATLGAVPPAIQYGLTPFEKPHDNSSISESLSCLIKRPVKHSFEFSAIFFFSLPMILITVLYVLIGVRLRNPEFRTPNSSIKSGNGFQDSFRWNGNGNINDKPRPPGHQDITTTSYLQLQFMKFQCNCRLALKRYNPSGNSRRDVIKMLGRFQLFLDKKKSTLQLPSPHPRYVGPQKSLGFRKRSDGKDRIKTPSQFTNGGVGRFSTLTRSKENEFYEPIFPSSTCMISGSERQPDIHDGEIKAT